MSDQKPREWWMYAPTHKGIAYVRPAVGIHEDNWPSPTAPWLRKLPLTKLVEASALEKAQEKIRAYESALRFYADRENHSVSIDDWNNPDVITPIDEDAGKIAREVLEKWK